LETDNRRPKMRVLSRGLYGCWVNRMGCIGTIQKTLTVCVKLAAISGCISWPPRTLVNSINLKQETGALVIDLLSRLFITQFVDAEVPRESGDRAARLPLLVIVDCPFLL